MAGKSKRMASNPRQVKKKHYKPIEIAGNIPQHYELLRLYSAGMIRIVREAYGTMRRS